MTGGYVTCGYHEVYIYYIIYRLFIQKMQKRDMKKIKNKVKVHGEYHQHYFHISIQMKYYNQ